MNIFNEKDFNSNDGMVTAIWGPGLWHSLHTISFNYPTNPDNKCRIRYYRFFKSLKHVLPCRYCRENYDKNIKSVGFGLSVFENRETLSRFVYDLHEEVNKNLNKESNLTYEDVRCRYENFRARCLEDKKIINESISIINEDLIPLSLDLTFSTHGVTTKLNGKVEILNNSNLLINAINNENKYEINISVPEVFNISNKNIQIIKNINFFIA